MTTRAEPEVSTGAPRAGLSRIPPVYFVLYILGMIALDALWPVHRYLGGAWRLLALPFGICGFCFVASSRALFAARGTTIWPFEESSVLVTDGLFRLSRNPMYTGLALTLVGIPIALMGLALYQAALYVGSIVVAGLVGSALLQPRGEGWGPFGLALLAGLTLTIVAANTPFVGILVKVLIVLLGLGLLTDRCRSGWRTLRGLPA